MKGTFPRNCTAAMLCAVILSGCCGMAAGRSREPHHRYNVLGNTAYEKADYRTAVKHYKKALEYAPEDHVIWSNLGDAYRRLNDHQQALSAYSRSIGVRSTYEPALFWRGWTHADQGEHDKAIVDFDKVIWSEKYRMDALLQRGWSYYHKKLHKEAHRDFSSALHADAGNQTALRGRAWISYHSGDFKGAIRDHSKALESIPKESTAAMSDALIGKAYAYVGVGDGETAVELARKAIGIVKEKSWNLTLIYYLSGDKSKAWEYRGGEGTLDVDVRDHGKGERTGAEVTRSGDREGGAAAHGLLEGDVIVAVNGAPVKCSGDFWDLIKSPAPGSPAELAVFREGKERKLRVTVMSAESAILSHAMAAPILKARRSASEGGGAAEPVPAARPHPAKSGAGPTGNDATDELQ